MWFFQSQSQSQRAENRESESGLLYIPNNDDLNVQTMVLNNMFVDLIKLKYVQLVNVAIVYKIQRFPMEIYFGLLMTIHLS